MSVKATYQAKSGHESKLKRILFHPNFYGYFVCGFMIWDAILSLILHGLDFETAEITGWIQILFLVSGLMLLGAIRIGLNQQDIIYVAFILLLLHPVFIINSGLMDARMSVHYVPIAFLFQVGQQNKKLKYGAFILFIIILLLVFLSIVLKPRIDLDVTTTELKIQIVSSMFLSGIAILTDYLWQKSRSYYLTIQKELTHQIGQVTSSFTQIITQNRSLDQIISSFEEKINLFFDGCQCSIQLTEEFNQKSKKRFLLRWFLEKKANQERPLVMSENEILTTIPDPVSSSMLVPIRVNNELKGIIQISNDVHYYFNESHVHLAEIIASLCASKILEFESNKIKYQTLELEFESKKLQELNELKSHFVHNISRDIQEPLQLILGPSSRLSQSQNETVVRFSKLINSNANQLKEILDQLLELGEIDITSTQLNLEVLDVGKLIHSWSDNFEHSAHEKGVTLSLSGPASLEIPTDRKKITSIIHNLVSNAIKYTPQGGEVEISYEMELNHFVFSVGDSGEGIPEVYHEKVFDRFFRLVEADGKGTGIGLSIVRELTEIMGGFIDITESRLGGAEFTFSYNTRYLEGVHPPDTIVKAEVKTPLHNSKKPLVLVTDDHQDVRQFICTCLADNYECVEANNGIEGAALAEQLIPDLIITDLMMPEMNGEEFCTHLRANEKTAHIPIVVLSAKSDSLSKVQLYEMGIDNYLTKPFESDELRAVVSTLIQSRELLRQKFRDKFTASVDLEDVYEPQETSFIEKVIQCIEANIDDVDFNVPMLCSIMKLGRNQLQRKTKAMTGFTPVELIRNVRLKKAAQMLTETDLNVSQVAFAVGFNSLSYFTRIFKDTFGCLPSQYKG
ncbi:MAG: response regulator [Flavobacteriales bacterium]|nr:response regulator [Flavobacteriales bacterium]